MSKPLKPDLKSIVAASVSRVQAASEVIPLRPKLAETAEASPQTLKQRAKQLSVYLEPPVYDQLRDIAYTERTKIHTLMLEALDLLFKSRGAVARRDLEMQAPK